MIDKIRITNNFFAEQFLLWILRDKKINDNLMYIPHDNELNYPYIVRNHLLKVWILLVWNYQFNECAQILYSTNKLTWL